MEVMEAIRTKKAVRLFTEQAVPHEDILKIVGAGRHSQSSKNTQPWEFIVVEQKETLLALSKSGNFAQHLAGAAFAVVLVSKDDAYWKAFDLGQAAAYMQLEADGYWLMHCGIP